MRQCTINRWCQLVVVVTLMVAANARAYEWNIGPWRAPLVGPAPITLEFSGLWPDTCIPKLASIRLVGDTLELRTHSATADCRPSETLFSIPLQLLPQISGGRSIAWLHRRDNEADYRLYGYRLHHPGDFPVIEPSSGWWWPEPGGPQDSGGPGTGLTIDYQQGLLTLLSQAYDALGNPEWQLATGALKGDIFNAPLIRFSNGQTLTGNFQLPDLTVGRDEISLQFHSALSVTAWFSHRLGNNLDSPIDLRSVSMIRYLMNPPVLDRLVLGRWLVTARLDPGSSLVVETVRIISIEQSGAEEVRLIGPQGQQVGNCMLERDRPEAAPKLCVLTGLEYYGDLSINAIGYDRMQGRDQNGRAVLLLRVP